MIAFYIGDRFLKSGNIFCNFSIYPPSKKRHFDRSSPNTFSVNARPSARQPPQQYLNHRHFAHFSLCSAKVFTVVQTFCRYFPSCKAFADRLFSHCREASRAVRNIPTFDGRGKDSRLRRLRPCRDFHGRQE